MNLEEARKVFDKDVMASKPDCVVVEGATREYPHCFVFAYQSKKFVETGDVAAMLVGHGPILVSRHDGKVFETGSAFSVEHYVKNFEACGDPFGEPTERVKITGWREGANKVEATRLVKSKTGMGLAQAKAVIDNALLNKESLLIACAVEEAEELVAGLDTCGFNATQLWNNQC